LLLALLFLAAQTRAESLPDFETDQQADVWLRANSKFYKTMAENADKRGGYSISRNNDTPGGLAYFKEGHGHIELNDRLKGPHRVSIIIFEMTNLYQEHRHQEVADRVRKGKLESPQIFGLLRETIEYDGLRLHRDVLLELKPVLGTMPDAMFTWVCHAKSFDTYQLPFVYDYIKAQESSGHTAHYWKLFEKHRAEFMKSEPRP
jgi:hypothetical protein